MEKSGEKETQFLMVSSANFMRKAPPSREGREGSRGGTRGENRSRSRSPERKKEQAVAKPAGRVAKHAARVLDMGLH